jgi:hypothetical protein
MNITQDFERRYGLKLAPKEGEQQEEQEEEEFY